MRRMSKIPKMLIDAAGGRFSTQLGINLTFADPDQIFKWFLASKLFGARISTDIAIRTYKEFERRRITSPDTILRTGWDGLVRILDDGGYVRYDFSTASKLLEIMADFKRGYHGDLNELHRAAINEEDLENRLKGLGKGIGDVTVNIFLRELRGVWEKADPALSEMVKLAAGNLGLIKQGEDPLHSLKKIWSAQKLPGKDFRDFESALLRLGKDYCRKSRHDVCPMRSVCKNSIRSLSFEQREESRRKELGGRSTHFREEIKMKKSRYLSVLIGSFFLFALSSPVAAGIEKEENVAVKEKFGGTPETKQEYPEKKKKEFENTAKEKVAEFDKKIRELEVKAAETGSKARDQATAGMKKGMKELKEKHKILEKDVNKLEKAGQKAWESAKKKVDEATDELQKAYDKVRAFFTSE